MMIIAKEYKALPQAIREKLKEANVFFSEEYGRYLESSGSKNWYLLDDNLIVPVKLDTKIGIKMALYGSEPFCLNGASDTKRTVAFLNEASALLKKEGVAWVNTSAAALFDVYPDKSQRIPFGSHIIDLTQPEEVLFSNMHSKHRNSIRRAEKSGVTISAGKDELIPDYVKADSETWERSGRSSYGDQFFKKILDSLGDKAKLYVAYANGEPQSGACFFVNKKMCYYMYGASLSKPEPGSANLLQWTAIKDMKAAGVEKFSFVGCRINEDEDSKYHGIQRFKERFGGELCQGYMFKDILKPLEYHIFRLLYKLRKGNDLSDAIDQEIRKWPELQSTICESNDNTYNTEG